MSSRDQYTEFKKKCRISSYITLKLKKYGSIDIVVKDELAISLSKNPEVDFEKLCEKLKQFVDTSYNCTFLDSEIAFPLLKKLIEAGDVIAKWAYKREYINKISDLIHKSDIKYINELNYLLGEIYVKDLNSEELNEILNDSNLPIMFEKPDSKIREFLLICLENDDRFTRINAAKILCKGKQKIINYLKIKIAKKDNHEKIVLIHKLLKSGYFIFINNENLRKFLEDLNQDIFIDLIKIAIENFIQLLENKNYESSIIHKNHILPSLRRIVGVSEDNLKKVFEEYVIKLVDRKKFFMNFYLFSGGYLTYLNNTEKTKFFNILSSKFFDKFEKDNNMDDYEQQILVKGFQALGVNSIGLMFRLLKSGSRWKWKKIFVGILIEIGKENRELIREEVFNIISTSKYTELSGILYYDKLINFLEKDDLVKLLNDPHVNLIKKLKKTLDDYESGNYSTAISLLIKMDEYGIETLLEWLIDDYHEWFDRDILEFFKSMGKKSVRLLHKLITKITQSEDFEGLFNLIRPDLVNNLPKDVIIDIFWSDDKLITSLVNLMEKKSEESLEFTNALKFLCETIGIEAETLLLRVFIHGVIHYAWPEIQYIKDYALQLIGSIKSEIRNIAHDQRIDLEFFEILYNTLLDNLEEQDLYNLLDDPENKFINAMNYRFEDTEDKFTEYYYKILFYIKLFERVEKPWIFKIFNSLNEELKNEIISNLENDIDEPGYNKILTILNEKKVIIKSLNDLKVRTSFPFFKELICILGKEDFAIPEDLTDLIRKFSILVKEKIRLNSLEFYTNQDKYFLKELVFEYEIIFQYIIFRYYSSDLNLLLKQFTLFLEILLFLNELLYYETENNFDFDFSVLSTENYEYNKKRGFFNNPSLIFRKQKKLFKKLGLEPLLDIPRIAVKWRGKKWEDYIDERDSNLKNEFDYYIAKRDYFDEVLADVSLNVVKERMYIKVDRIIPLSLREKLLKIKNNQCEFIINEENAISGLALERRYNRESAYKFLLDIKPEYQNKSKENFINALSNERKQTLEEEFIDALKQKSWEERKWVAEDFGYIKSEFKNKSYNQIVSELDEKTQNAITDMIKDCLWSGSNIEKIEKNRVRSLTETLMAINSEKSVTILRNFLRNIEYIDLRDAIIRFLENNQKSAKGKLLNLKFKCKYPDGAFPPIENLISVYNLQGFGHSHSISSIEVSPDGNYVITADDITIRIWEIKTGNIIRVIYGYPNGKKFLITSSGKEIVSWTQKHQLKLWDFATGNLVKETEFNEDEYVFPIKWNNRDIYYIVKIKNELLKVMNHKTGQIVSQLRGEFNNIYSFCISPKKKYILTSSKYNEIKIWDFKNGGLLYKIESESNVKDWGTRPLVLTNDEKYLVTTHKKRKIEIFDITIKEVVRMLEHNEGPITSLLLSLDNRKIISAGTSIKVWDFETGDLINEINVDDYIGKQLKLSPDGKYIICPYNSGFGVYELDSLKLTYSFNKKSSRIPSSSFAVSPDGKYMINDLNIWEIESGELLSRLTGHTDKVVSLVVSSDSRYLLSGSVGGNVNVRDLFSFKLLKTFKGHKSRITSVSFSHYNNFVISSSIDGTLSVWDFFSEKRIKTFSRLSITADLEESSGKSLYSAAMSNNKKYIAGSFYPGKLFIWDYKTGKIVHQLEGNGNNITFTPDNKEIICYSGSGTNIWDLETGKLVKDIDILNFRFLIKVPNGKRIICGTIGNSIIIYDLKKDQRLVEFKCNNYLHFVHHIPNTFSVIALYNGDEVRIWDFGKFIEGQTL